MAARPERTDSASILSAILQEQGFSPFFGTPCGILAPLYACLQTQGQLLTVLREDNAVGVAAGSAMTGKSPVVLMQNSGFGQSVNAVASLVIPYDIPILFIISMRGTDCDTTKENEVMGRVTKRLLAESGIPAAELETAVLGQCVEWAWRLVAKQRTAAALLVPPTFFGWRP